MLTVLGITLFALVLLLSIAWHEIGHLVPAKRFGVRVTQYMVGFGPTLWSTRRGETEYGIKAIPLGGYIRMIGMFPPQPGADPSRLRRSSTGPFQALAEDARRASLEEVRPGDEDRVFYKLRARRKVVVMLGGPVMNLVLGAVLVGVAFSAIGIPDYERATPTLTVERVPECVLTAEVAATRATCQPGDPASPAAAAGFLPGDVVTAFDGQAVSSWEELQPLIREHPVGAPVEIAVERDGQPEVLTATLARNQVRASNDDESIVEVSYLGIAPTQVVPRRVVPVAELPGQLAELVGRTAGAVLGVPERMVGVWQAAFGGQEREVDGPVGIVGVSRIGGEVAALEEVPTYAKAAQFVLLAGSVNIALFVFNLIPLLPLDGGHVAGALYEGTRRHLARLRGRPDPGPVDVAKMLPVAYTVAILLIGMSGLLLYADLVNPIRLANL